MTHPLHLSTTLPCDANVAYAFLSDPTSFKKWASGLGTLTQQNGAWVAGTPEGPLPVRFSGKNPYGILDHWVSPKQGPEIHIPVRVIPNGETCELVFTLFRQPGMTDEKFAADEDWVKRDLEALKRLLKP